MAAQTDVLSFHGAAGGTTTAASDMTNSTFRHKRADNDTQDLNAPIVLPTGAGEAYSWRKHTKLWIITGPNQKIENLRWFADSDPDSTWTGVNLYAGYTETASYTQGSSGDESAQIPASDDADNIDSGSPITVQAGVLCISTDSYPLTAGSGSTQDYIVTQISGTSLASSGVITKRQVRYRFDEI